MRLPPVIVPHASFESLLDAICREWIARVRTPVPQPVVIPSIPFSDFLQLRIANRIGVCMGIDFLTSQDFIHRATGRRAEEAWSRRGMTWRVLPHVGHYASKLGVSEPSPRDRFALAGLLADQFDQYGHFRPEIIQDWAANRFAFSATDRSDEGWQRGLWRALRQEAGIPHPAELFRELEADKNFRRQLAERFPRLLVLGSGVIDPLLVKVLGLLAEAGGEVEIHVLLPSMEFLGDLRNRNVPLPADQDPETISSGANHPLLESMGRHAVGTFLLLGQLDEQYTDWPEPGGGDSDGGNLLQRLQSDIRSLRGPDRVAHSADDSSIRVHSCFGARREMEVLKDEILRAFRELPDLRPEEIHIVAPSLETYAPLVPAVLAQGGTPLAVRLMELPAGAGEPTAEAVLSLLEMARGERYEASWLMELVQLEAVQKTLEVFGDDSAVERLRGWIRGSGVMRGIDAPDVRPGTWGFARDRLIAGRWFGTNDAIRYPDGEFVLPVAEELTGDEKLNRRFVSWFVALEDTMREWQSMACASAWGQRIARACAALLAADDEAALAMQPHLAFLQEIGCPEEVDAGAILDWLRGETQESGRRSRVSGQIPFGRFKQLQNIPCRVLAMVGMQDGAFPAQSRPPAWDLLRKAPKVWDRNARIDDRQLFLDALLTPRERLIVTAATRNVRTKKTEPFSSCVDELLRVAEAMGASRDGLVIEHRLQPFAADYFRNSGLPRSFSPEFVRVAGELERPGEREPAPFWNSNAAGVSVSPEEIALGQLIGFWKDPAKAYLRTQGISIPGGEDDDEALDRSEVTVNKLAEWGLKNAIVGEVAAGGDLARTEAVLRANRGLPPGHLGTSVWAANMKAGKALGESVRDLSGDKVPMEVSLPGLPRITGAIQKTRAGDRLLAWRPLAFKSPRHFIEPWICAVFAAAGGESLPSALLDPDARETPSEKPAIAEEEARVILGDLVAGFLEGQSRPLGYAPATSKVLARALDKVDAEEAVPKAADEWSKEDKGHGGGEGSDVAAQWAWRDRDPFANGADWCDWAGRIAAPLRAWEEANE